MAKNIRGRFAPSPSGRLHLGNMASSLLAWLDARSLGGEMIFRLEDLDPERSYADYAALMAEDLRWLGLDWDAGWPEDGGYAQGGRSAYYEEAFEQLERLGVFGAVPRGGNGLREPSGFAVVGGKFGRALVRAEQRLHGQERHVHGRAPSRHSGEPDVPGSHALRG